VTTRAMTGMGLALVCAALASGCYTYVPADPGAIVPGSDVRVEMTRLGFAALPQIPSEPGPRLHGTLVSRENGSILLRVPVLIRRDAQVLGSIDQDLTIPVSEVLTWEARELHPVRTGFALAGVIVGALGAWFAFGAEGPPPGEPPVDPPDEEVPGFARIELFSLPVPPFGR
jgi:hypothetical protein